MQRTINSNAAIRDIIFTKCTPVGQYRQAVLQLEEAVRHIEELERAKRKLGIEKRLKELEIKKLREWGSEEAFLEAEKKEIEIEEIESGEREIEKSLVDYYREAKVCEECIEKIKRESGIDYGSLGVEEFQALMEEEYYMNYARNLSAQIIAADTGCPLPVAQSLLELGESKREEMRLRIQQLVKNVSLLEGKEDDRE